MLKPPSFERQDEFQFELYKETLAELGFSNKDSFRPVVATMTRHGKLAPVFPRRWKTQILKTWQIMASYISFFLEVATSWNRFDLPSIFCVSGESCLEPDEFVVRPNIGYPL